MHFPVRKLEMIMMMMRMNVKIAFGMELFLVERLFLV